MRRTAMPPIKEGGVNVTPLIDIVMCLIIFFMLVAKIGVASGVDPNIKDIPQSVLGTDLRSMGNTFTLNVINGPEGVPDAQPIVTALVGGGNLQEIKLRDVIGGQLRYPLRDTLLRFREGDPSRNLPPNPSFKVIIRGDKSLKYQFLGQVLMECNQAHVATFAFDTKEPS